MSSTSLSGGNLVDGLPPAASMAGMAFKMIIFDQFRHALTRHDPKTYLPWLVELILLKLKE